MKKDKQVTPQSYFFQPVHVLFLTTLGVLGFASATTSPTIRMALFALGMSGIVALLAYLVGEAVSEGSDLRNPSCYDYKTDIKTTFGSDGTNRYVHIVKMQTFDFDASDFVIGELPDSCSQCPYDAYTILGASCGRIESHTETKSGKRPSTCKLISLEEYLARMEKDGHKS